MKSDTVVNECLFISHLKFWCKVQVQLGTNLKNVRGKIKLNFRPKLAAAEKVTANSSQVGEILCSGLKLKGIMLTNCSLQYSISKMTKNLRAKISGK